MLMGLIYGPVHRLESFFVVHTQCLHQAKWIAHTDTKRLASNCASSHSIEDVHNLGDPAKGRIASIERCVERLTLWRNHVLVQAKPVHIRATHSPSLATESKLASLTRNVRTAFDRS